MKRIALAATAVTSAALTLTLTGVAAATTITTPIDGTPVPVITTTGSHYGGSAGVPLVYLNALNLGSTLDVAAADIAPAESEVNSAGLAGLKGTIRSYSRATNVDANVLSGALPLSLVNPVTQSTSYGTPKAVTGGLVNLPAAPLANVDVVANSAHATVSKVPTCSSTLDPISESTEQVASADVLPTADAGAPILSVTNKNGGAIYTNSVVGLLENKGSTDREGVESNALTQLTDISLFGGTVELQVAAPPSLTANATGKPGGATVVYNEPTINVLLAGKQFGVLDNANQSITLPLLGTLSLGQLTDVKKAANGTSASGSAALVNLDVDALGVLQAVDLQIAPATVSASVPEGGVACATPVKKIPNPFTEAHKDASASTVPPGATFNYTVTVPNRSTCTLQNVTVIDHSPSGLIFDSSTPPPSSRSGQTITYKIGTLKPNATKNITITYTVPTDAAAGTHYVNHAVITGDCGSTKYTKPVQISQPTVGPVNTGGCLLNDSNKASDHIDVKTGETFNYYIHVFNSGGSSCDDVTVTDKLIPGESFVSCSNSCHVSGTTITWDLGTLTSGQSKTLSLELKATAKSGLLHNKAVIKSPSAPNPVTVVAHGPKITTISKLAPPDPAKLTRSPSNGNGNGNKGNGNSGSNLPDTGGSPLFPIIGLSVMGLAGLAARRLRLSRRV